MPVLAHCRVAALVKPGAGWRLPNPALRSKTEQCSLLLDSLPRSKAWRASSPQELLSDPKITDPANLCYETYKKDRKEFDR